MVRDGRFREKTTRGHVFCESKQICYIQKTYTRQIREICLLSEHKNKEAYYSYLSSQWYLNWRCDLPENWACPAAQLAKTYFRQIPWDILFIADTSRELLSVCLRQVPLEYFVLNGRKCSFEMRAFQNWSDLMMCYGNTYWPFKVIDTT